MNNYKYTPSRYRNGFRWCEGKKPKRMCNNKLYHYTSLYRAFQIIITGGLYFSELNRVNDINERKRLVFGNEGSDLDVIEDELSHHKQLSFCMDDERPGYAIPAMWGHYGDSGQGACLVFDKDALLANLPKDAVHHKITYTGEYYADADSSIQCTSDNVQAFFKENIIKIFFEKTNDWSYEQEYRVILRTNNKNLPDVLPIKDSLCAVIIFMPKSTPKDGCVLNSEEYIALSKLVPDISILGMGKFLNDFGLYDSNGEQWIIDDKGFHKESKKYILDLD